MNDNNLPKNERVALLYDDNLMTIASVQSQLQKAGYKVLTPRQATPESSVDAVLINLGSRSLKGVELISQTKAQFPAAKVFGYCGHVEIEIRRAAKAAGIDRLITNEDALARLVEVLN